MLLTDTASWHVTGWTKDQPEQPYMWESLSPGHRAHHQITSSSSSYYNMSDVTSHSITSYMPSHRPSSSSQHLIQLTSVAHNQPLQHSTAHTPCCELEVEQEVERIHVVVVVVVDYYCSHRHHQHHRHCWAPGHCEPDRLSHCTQTDTQTSRLA